ncbi:MAG: UDP-N-acetylglucosamine 2-epimerase (non-hydrolyzing) [Rhizobacter sp.]
MGHIDIELAMAAQRAAPEPTEATILCVVGARPNYMKIAPLLRALACTPGAPKAVLVHTGQHYDPALKDRLFEDLGLRQPDENLDVRSGSHAVQTAEVMKRFEPLIDKYQPACVVVVGDVNSTLACSLVAAKRCVPVVHVEAGLRSYDRTMPEEINRVLTDQISELLYTTDRDAHVNLALEGISGDHVVFVGNLMIDSLHDAYPRSFTPEHTLRDSGADVKAVLERGFALVTLHRPSNVDDPAVLGELVELLRSTSERLGLIWPMHPRARAQLERFGLMHRLASPRIVCLPPQGYLEMVGLMRAARVAITDSGGVQEETTALGIPCLTLRDNTERPVTVTHGTNRLMKRDVIALHSALDAILGGAPMAKRLPEGWDGQSGERIATHLVAWLAQQR